MTESFSTRYVPDEGPENAKIVFVGEAPGADEDRLGQPFIGESGNKLTTCLGRNGLSREEVRLANLFHYKPPKNDFSKTLDDPRLHESIAELKTYLDTHRPNVVCALGNWPLYFLTRKQGKKPGSGILNWRGSILECTLVPGIKVIPTIHPAAVLREASHYPTFDLDIRRVKEDSLFPELRLPERSHNIIHYDDTITIQKTVDELMSAKRLSVDIETFGPRLACVGFSSDPMHGHCFIWSDNSFSVREAITTLLDSNIPKTFHFGTFDTEYLHGFYGIETRNYDWDTMVGQHIMAPELPRALKYLSSIYTREPYYKDEGREAQEDNKRWNARTNPDKLWIYNSKDCCVTAEIQLEQEREMKEGPEQWTDYFKYEMELARDVLPEIMRAGMLVDMDRRKLLDGALLYEYQERQQGLQYACGANVNVNSPKQVQQLLYWNFGLPPRINKRGKRTADGDALISLLQLCTEKMHEVKRESTKEEWMKKALSIKLILLTRQTRKLRSSYVNAKVSPDGRWRSTYKVAATETGRLAAEKYVDGTGFNAQTMPRDPLEIDDEIYAKLLAGEAPQFEVENEEDEDDESEED
jgi:DNA polymerase